MNFLKGVLRFVFSLGICEHLPESEEYRRIFLSNQIILLLASLAAPYYFIFHYIGLPSLAHVVILIDIVFVCCFFFNYFSYYSLARLSIILGPADAEL